MAIADDGLEYLTDTNHEAAPDARLATVRVEEGRIEVILLDHDPEWVSTALETGSKPKPDGKPREFIIGNRAPNAEPPAWVRQWIVSRITRA